jgi:hypothetical protein
METEAIFEGWQILMIRPGIVSETSVIFKQLTRIIALGYILQVTAKFHEQDEIMFIVK